MLIIKTTPHLAGISLSGDFEDFQRLYEALIEILGEEQEPGEEYEMPVIYILAACYELRQSIMGNRSVEFIANRLDAGTQQNLKTLGPQHNVYFKTRFHLPEILFDIMALSDFIEIYSRKIKIPALNRDIQMVQLFQAEVTAALQSLLDQPAANRLARLVYGVVPRFRGYCTQYVDMLTEKYLRQTPEKRLQQIVPIARKFNEKGPDYHRLLLDLVETADELQCSLSDLESIKEMPELTDQEW
jgi:hypothetical protein